MRTSSKINGILLTKNLFKSNNDFKVVLVGSFVAAVLLWSFSKCCSLLNLFFSDFESFIQWYYINTVNMRSEFNQFLIELIETFVSSLVVILVLYMRTCTCGKGEQTL